MFESGMHRAGALAASARCAAGKLQQLWGTAAQRAATAATAVPDARTTHEELPADGTRSLKILRGYATGQRRADRDQFSGTTGCSK